MVKSALPSVVGALGGSDQLGSVVSDAVGSAITPAVPAPESTTTTPADTMSDESLLKLAQKLKVLMGTTPGVIPPTQTTEKLQWGGSVLFNAISSAQKVKSDIDSL